MKIFNYTTPKIIIADEGKVLRATNDIYIEEHIDENGEKVEEYIPYKSTIIFLPNNLTEEEIKELYIEE